MPGQGRRIDRLEGQFRLEISNIIEREIHDPRVGFATVTAVRLSGDMRHARVFISTLGGEEERKRILAGLKSASSFIRRMLGHNLHHLRRIPELTFEYDDSFEHGNRIEELLSKIKPGRE